MVQKGLWFFNGIKIFKSGFEDLASNLRPLLIKVEAKVLEEISSAEFVASMHHKTVNSTQNIFIKIKKRHL